MNTDTKPQHSPTPWKIRPAHTISQRSGREVRAGWDLFYGDEWSQRYPNKREAEAALMRVRGGTP